MKEIVLSKEERADLEKWVENFKAIEEITRELEGLLGNEIQKAYAQCINEKGEFKLRLLIEGALKGTKTEGTPNGESNS